MALNLQQIEESFIGEIQNSLTDKLSYFKNPDSIFFTSWTFTQPEGRMTNVWHSTMEVDTDMSRLVRIWSFIFPELREDYLVERIWKWMISRNMDRNFLSICFCDNPTKGSGDHEICIKSEFKDVLEGKHLKDTIDDKCQAMETIYSEIEPLAFNLKIARILKHNSNFVRTQIDGIDKAFSMWITNTQIREKLDPLLNQLYGRDNPTRYPLDARKFLTMWQNFSVISPDYSHVVLHFHIPRPGIKPEARYALALFYRDKVDLSQQDIRQMNNITNEIFVSVCLSQLTGELQIQKENEHKEPKKDSIWIETKKRNLTIWNSIRSLSLIEDKLDNLMELAGHLAFATHEARPCKFTFLAGTEQIWPAIEEIISLNFYKQELLSTNEFDPDLFAKLCEANYSIFQIDGVVGFYNTEYQSMHKIIRLSYPTKEEQRLLEYPIIDLDDLFCWSIKRIYEQTNGVERSFIVCSTGNGKVSIHGLKEVNKQNKEDLLLIWDVRKGELYEPVPNDELKEIADALEAIGIASNSKEYNELIKAIRKISAIPGEGAALIIASDERIVDKYVTTMELLTPCWLETLDLNDPQYILKAAFIMDGACMITRSKITPRLTVYPFHNNNAWGLKTLILDDRFKNNLERIVKKLSGKGAKTHVSSNISTLPLINPDKNNPQVVIVSISADGPIKIWPAELLS